MSYVKRSRSRGLSILLGRRSGYSVVEVKQQVVEQRMEVVWKNSRS